MANIKISALPTTGVSTPDDYFVINDAALTTTSKIQLKNFVGLIQGSGTNSMVSAPFLTSGFPATSTGNESITLGFGASGASENGIAIGRGAEATSPDSIAIGTRALNQNRDNTRSRYIAIGFEAEAITDTFALGTRAKALGTDCVAIGRDSRATGNGQISLGAQATGDGVKMVNIGFDNGASNLNMDNTIMIGQGIRMNDGVTKSIAIGFEAETKASGAINISTSSFRASSPHSINIGGTGNTYGGSSQQIGIGNIRIGGFNDSITFTPGSFNTFLGGKNNTINSSGGGGVNNVFLGMSGRTLQTNIDNQTHVENLRVFGAIRQNFVTFSTSGSVVVDVATMGYVQLITTSGETYDIQVSPGPNEIGDTVTFFITYQSGATVNFVPLSSTSFRFNPDFGTPVFSGSPESRSILVFNTWDGNDMWEVSRSMNMV